MIARTARPTILVLLAVVALALSACTATTSGRGSETSSKRPNIVFVLTDDLAWNLIRHMPNVQDMQKSGATMTQYYVVDSLCCPSRSAIFTGQYPHNNGVFTNAGADGGYNAYNEHGNEKKSFGLALQQQGYRTGFMGKYLNGYKPDDPVPPGWDEWDVTGKGYGEYNYSLNQNGTQQRYGRAPDDYLVDVMSRKAGSFIDAAASADKPFMLELATFAPHAPYTPAPRHVGAADSVEYPKTPAYDTLPTNPPSWLADRPALTSEDQTALNQVYQKRVEADLAVDDLIGSVRQQLQAKGLADNTYIVFSSDNGYHLGEYRLLAGKQTAFDTDTHVPLIVTGPGVPAGRSVDQLTSNIDLAPTFETLTGATIGSDVDGVSMDGLWHGADPPDWQKGVLIEHHGPNDSPSDPDRQNEAHANPPSYEAVRTADALYVQYASGEQEYYDTTDDPDQLHNLGGDAVPPALTRMLSALQNCHGAAACQAAARSG